MQVLAYNLLNDPVLALIGGTPVLLNTIR
jgi:hypothetical protein